MCKILIKVVVAVLFITYVTTFNYGGCGENNDNSKVAPTQVNSPGQFWISELKRYEERLKINPKDKDAWRGKAFALEALGRNEEALSSYEEILRIDPRDKDAWHKKGVTLEILGMNEEALSAYEEVLKIDPKDKNAWYKKGSAFSGLKRYKEALSAYEEALNINPKDEYAWYGKGFSLGNLGRNEEALSAYEEALNINPKDEYAWYGKGFSLGNLGRNEEALSAYEEALKINPKNKNVWYNKGAALAALGRNEEALSVYEEAQKLDPADKKIAGIIENLKSELGAVLSEGKEKAPTLKEIKKPEYPEATAPDESPIFLWDFSQTKVLTYTYETNMQTYSEMNTNHNMNTMGSGLLLIKSKGDNTADMVIKDLKMSMSSIPSAKEDTKDMEFTMPPIICQGMKEDGTAKFGKSQQEAMLEFLFPLPNKSLKKGESVKLPDQFPYNAGGSPLEVTGYTVITLTGYVTIGKRICAEFDVLTDISELKIPPEIEGSYEGSLKGKSVLYFDIKERCFVGSIISVVMQMKTDIPMPKMNFPNMPDNMPKRMQMSMIMDTQMKVSLKDEN